MQTVLRDLRFGAKMFVRERLFTAVAVAMLALGIGANTAIFSVVNAVLLRALPYRDADRLIALDARSANDRRALFSIEELEAFQQRMQTLEGLATSSTQSVNLTGGERPARVRGAFVSATLRSDPWWGAPSRRVRIALGPPASPSSANGSGVSD
jgi:putative ABC transport system permease protein